MNKWMLLPIGLFLLGLIFIGYGIIIGEVQVGLAVFIPFILSNGIYGLLGISCFFTSMLSFFFILPKLSLAQLKKDSFHLNHINSQSDHTMKTGGVIFIGPIPIIFGSNKKITQIMILVSIIIFLIIFFSIMLHFY